jgi:hypothetical protein
VFAAGPATTRAIRVSVTFRRVEPHHPAEMNLWPHDPPGWVPRPQTSSILPTAYGASAVVAVVLGLASFSVTRAR